MVLQTGLILNCSAENYEASPSIIENCLIEKNLANKTLNSCSFINKSSKRTKSSDLIRLNDSVNNMNLSLSIQPMNPITYIADSLKDAQTIKINNVKMIETEPCSHINNLVHIENSSQKCLKEIKMDRQRSNIKVFF